MILESVRKDVADYCRNLLSHRLTRGTGGNISIFDREQGLIAISPSGVEYTSMKPEDVVVVDETGKVADGKLKPSSELGMHLACYQARGDISAVVHTHSTFATTVACTQQDVPPVSYLIAFAGQSTVPCIPYYSFGSKELADAAGAAFRENRNLHAVLLGNHGLVACHTSIGDAFSAAEEIEFVCELYYRAKLLGDVHLLSESEVKDTLERFSHYGQGKKA
jgi:L-fuculose-phosphate aldolase